MAKNRVHKKSAPSYAAALAAMKERTHDEVQSAIARSARSLPDKIATALPNGAQACSLFDGIISALANRIHAEARPGCADEMARLVGNMLISKVAELGCAGRA